MRSAAHDLELFLEDLAGRAEPGERLPPIRELMSRFGASQMVVQRALRSLKSRGLIDSQVGRGTFFRGRTGNEGRTTADVDDAVRARAPAARSVLLLRRSISIARGRVLAEGLQQRLTADGHKVLEVSYTDPEHARAVLKGLPRFDACVVQSSYRTIPIDLLAALKEKSTLVAVDGLSLAGTDVEAVGTEWGQPLQAAVEALQQQGHQRIACAMTSHPFLATQLGWRRFDCLDAGPTERRLHRMTVPLLPDHQDYAETLAKAIASEADEAGRLPFSALVAWGIEDGARFRQLLSGMGFDIPGALSVVLLGRTDLPNEHAGFFDVVGCSVADQIEALRQAIRSRWADPSLPYGVHLTPVTTRRGESTAAPAARSQGRPQARATVSAVSASDSPR